MIPLIAAWAILQAGAPLRLVATIPLPGVEGRIDHMAADEQGQRLFIAALGNNTLEVVDLRAGARTHTIRGLKEPQGVAFSPELNRIFVANGQGEGCDVYDGTTFAKLKTIRLGDDSDNVRYDSRSKQVVVGYGSGALAFINGSTYQEPLFIGLQAHPESFQLETSGTRVYVNVPDAEQIAIIDRAKKSVIAHWPVTAAKSNFPMALDEENHVVIVGCRRPAKALVYDTRSGKLTTSFDIVGDTDDLFVDHERHRIYVAGGEGYVDVFADGGGSYRRIQRIATAPGARTAFFIPSLHRLCVAVPHRGFRQASLLVFDTGH